MGRKQDQIASLALFRGCKRSEIEWLAGAADMLDAGAGSTLAMEGRSVREFMVVIEGFAGGSNGSGEVLIGPGSYLGELGLIDGRTHDMTVVARTDVRVLVFEARVFRAMIQRMPAVGRKLMTELVTRLRQADDGSKRSLAAVS